MFVDVAALSSQPFLCHAAIFMGSQLTERQRNSFLSRALHQLNIFFHPKCNKGNLFYSCNSNISFCCNNKIKEKRNSFTDTFFGCL